jgi:hyaluronan synthase
MTIFMDESAGNGTSNPYPLEKPDRRRRSRTRPDYSDRRSSPRYFCNFPVEIFLGEGQEQKVYHAMARDISDGGLLLENVDIPEDETRLRLNFKIPAGSVPEEYLHGRYLLEAEVAYRSRQGDQIGITFTRSLSHFLEGRLWFYLRTSAAVLFFLAVSVVMLIKYENFYFFWFDVPVFLYSLAVGSFLLSRFVFAALYQPPKPMPEAALPRVSMVIPAFNEEEHIERTLVQAMEVAYPEDKIQVITVNDGSTDRTLEVMHRVRDRYPELIVVDFDANQGKRMALAAGVNLANGEIVVFVDSDSFLEPQAIRRLVEGFGDPEVAAVCGTCEVENKWSNLLCKMQAVRYFVSFRIMKAAESLFSTVTCLSGPLSAYRHDVLMQHLQYWLHQSYCGVTATFGDDRSLTTSLLRRHKIIFDSRAVTTTIVPENYCQFMRQQLRWKRSWFRESIRAAGFMWRKPPLAAISFYLGILLPILGPAIVTRAILYVPLFHNGSPLMYLSGVFLMSMMMSLTYLFFKRSNLWIYGVIFCFFYMFVIIWQLPWAMATYMASSWSTRGD